MKRYTEAEVAAALHRSRPWFVRWVRANPVDKDGRPLFAQMGRSKRFTGDDVVKIIDLILTQEETAKPQDEGCIYFLDSGDHIKIGYSRSMSARLKKMSTDVPGEFKILHTEPGTFKIEKVLHREFASIRVRGEWFQRTPELLAFIEQRRALHPSEARP